VDRRQWIKRLTDEIAELRERHLRPLEEGRFRILRGVCGGPATDLTQKDLETLRTSIAKLQAAIDRYDAEYGGDS
jgi:hypothetical protein